MPAVVLGQVLVYGAFFVSLGVLLATRCRRPSRAVLATVVIYVVIALVVPAVCESFFLSSNRTLAEGLGTLSPIGGPIVTLMSMFSSPYFSTTREILPYAIFWLFLAAYLRMDAHLVDDPPLRSLDRKDWMIAPHAG